MRIMVKTAFALMLLFFMNSNIYSECLSEFESYKKYVENITVSNSLETNEKSIESLKMHLKCHHDKDVLETLASIYEYLGKYYLAELAYKKAGATDKFIQADKNRIENLNSSGINKFQELSADESKKLSQLHLEFKALSIISFVIGSAAFSTGAALFIHDKAGGTNSLAAQYSTMLGGLSFIAGGIVSDFNSKRNLAVSDAISRGAKTYEGDNGTTPEEYYIYSGNKNKTQKNLSKMYRDHGITLMALSIPLFIISSFSMYDTFKDDGLFKAISSYDLGDSIIVGFIAVAGELATIALGAGCLVGGITMIVYSNKWEKGREPKSILELTNFTPIIDPVSKTYGLSMGFSF
mgnify:CR=1 FL=1